VDIVGKGQKEQYSSSLHRLGRVPHRSSLPTHNPEKFETKCAFVESMTVLVPFRRLHVADELFPWMVLYEARSMDYCS
jgi:acetylglutamate synthase